MLQAAPQHPASERMTGRLHYTAVVDSASCTMHLNDPMLWHRRRINLRPPSGCISLLLKAEQSVLRLVLWHRQMSG